MKLIDNLDKFQTTASENVTFHHVQNPPGLNLTDNGKKLHYDKHELLEWGVGYSKTRILTEAKHLACEMFISLPN